MYNYDVYLGCFGLRQDGFICCGGVENVILEIRPNTPHYKEMSAYFDNCRLFDKPMFDFNAVRHFINNMQNRYDQVTRPLWTPKKYDLLQKFVVEHRHCGVFIQLRLPIEEADKTTKDVSKLEIPVKHEAVQVIEAPKNGLRLVR